MKEVLVCDVIYDNQLIKYSFVEGNKYKQRPKFLSKKFNLDPNL